MSLPSIVCQFLYLFMINFRWSNNHSLPNAVQWGVLSSHTGNLTLRRAHKFSIRFKSGEEGGQVIIRASLRPLLASQAVEYLDGMWWSIVLHKDHGRLECWGPPVLLLEESIFQKLAVGLGVEFQSIFHPKRSNYLILNDSRPHQYPSSTLLVPDSKSCPVSITDPDTGHHPSGPSRVTHFICP
jgi:hypothetical protein